MTDIANKTAFIFSMPQPFAKIWSRGMNSLLADYDANLKDLEEV